MQKKCSGVRGRLVEDPDYVQDAVIRPDQLTIFFSHRKMLLNVESLNPTFATLETCSVLAEDASLPSSPDVILSWKV